MASSTQTGDFMEEFICPICLERLNVPVTLECGHNFCKSCIDRVWDSEKQPSCPECRQEFPSRKYAVNRLLANVIERFQVKSQKEEGPNPYQKDQLCMEHKKGLELFCQEDETLVCSLCVPEHQSHTFLTPQKALDMYKANLTTSLVHQQSCLKPLEEIKSQQELKISEITTSARSFQLHIASEFAKLHQFLQKKEEKLVQQLKEEETGILRQMKENLNKIQANISAIEESISYIYLQLQQQDAVIFLKEIKSFTERLKKDKEKNGSQYVVALRLSQGAYKGLLEYSVWKEMKSFITLNFINISPRPKTDFLCHFNSQEIPILTYKNPPPAARWVGGYLFGCVEESEEFTSGSHYWEVEVKDMTEWIVGVARKPTANNCIISVTPAHGFWTLSLHNTYGYSANDSQRKGLRLNVTPQKIGVFLDCEGGHVSFYDADNMSHIYSFTHILSQTFCSFFLLQIPWHSFSKEYNSN